MIARVRAWHQALSQRERVLVTSAAVLTALLVLVYGIVLPAGSAYEAAALRHGEATARSGRILAGLDALKAPAPKVAGAAGPVDQQVAASAEAAGFVLQSNQPRGADQTVILLPTARASVVLAWLDGLVGQGLVIDSLTMTPAPDGSVAVNATLRRSGS